MPRKSRNLPPLKLGPESIGQRLARIRKEKGYTQTELAEQIGIIQVSVSDYERGRLQTGAEMLARFALALEVSADELLGLDRRRPAKAAPPAARKFLRRMQQIDRLPRRDQEALLRTIDAFLAKAA